MRSTQGQISDLWRALTSKYQYWSHIKTLSHNIVYNNTWVIRFQNQSSNKNSQVWQFWGPGAQHEPLKQLESHFWPVRTERAWFNHSQRGNNKSPSNYTYTVGWCWPVEAPWRVCSRHWQCHTTVSFPRCRACRLKFLFPPLESLEVAQELERLKIPRRVQFGWTGRPVRLFRSSSLVHWSVLLLMLAITDRANLFS